MIVVGFIDTAEGNAALQAAAARAQESGDEVLVVAYAGRGADEDAAKQAGIMSSALLQDRNIEHEVKVLERGSDVAEELMDAAESSDASLIVIGLRRRSPLGKLILGSNAQRILLDASCPVLAVKPEAA